MNLQNACRWPTKLYTDAGLEFRGGDYQRLLDAHSVAAHSVKSYQKAAIVEIVPTLLRILFGKTDQTGIRSRHLLAMTRRWPYKMLTGCLT